MKVRESTVMIEALEDRKLLSAVTTAAAANVPATLTQAELASLNTFYYQAGVAALPANVVAIYPAPADGAVPTSIMIDWGDGTPASAGTYMVTVASTGFPGAIQLPAGDAVIEGTHTYVPAGNYTVTVTGVVGSNATPTVLAVSQSQVTAPPAAAAPSQPPTGSVSAIVGEPVQNPVAYYPAPATAPTSVMIDWGDGTPATAGTYAVTGPNGAAYSDAIVLSPGVAVITGMHTYAATGNYTITVTGFYGPTSTPTTLEVISAQVIAPPASTGTTPGAAQPPTLAVNGTLTNTSNNTAIGTTATPSSTATNTSTDTPSTAGQTGKLTFSGTGSTTSNPASVLNLNKSDKELDVLTVNPGESVTRATAGVAGSQLAEAWTAPTSLTAAPKVIIHWGDGTTSTYQFTSASQLTATSSTQWIEDSHTYRKHGKYHAVAVFKENGKIIDHVTDVLTIEKSPADKLNASRKVV